MAASTCSRSARSWAPCARSTAYLAVKAKLATERAGVPDDQPDRLDFYVRTGMAGEVAEDVQLYMLIHPDDDGSMKPVATVMFPDED
jgi:hypothetical protein